MSLAAQDLVIIRGGNEILHGVTVACAPGEVVGLLGPNGAGKSTLLHGLAGGLLHAGGQVTLDGEALDAIPRDARARRLAVQSQSIHLGFEMPVHEVVRLGRLPWRDERTPRATEIVHAALDAVGLRARIDDPYGTLSGGQQQRVQLARALAQLWSADRATPGYLLLDEPSAHQDPRGTAQVIACARSFAADGHGVICVLHDLNLAATAFDRLVLMRAGEIVGLGTPGEVLHADLLTAVYQTDLTVLPPDMMGHPVVLHSTTRGETDG